MKTVISTKPPVKEPEKTIFYKRVGPKNMHQIGDVYILSDKQLVNLKSGRTASFDEEQFREIPTGTEISILVGEK